ncbi:unnamed protein product [Mucor hiemalis]
MFLLLDIGLCYGDATIQTTKSIVVIDKFSCPESNSQPYRACESLPDCLGCLKDADGVCNKYVKTFVMDPILCEKCSRWAQIFICQKDPSLVPPLVVDSSPPSQQLKNKLPSSSQNENQTPDNNRILTDDGGKHTNYKVNSTPSNTVKTLVKDVTSTENNSVPGKDEDEKSIDPNAGPLDTSNSKTPLVSIKSAGDNSLPSTGSSSNINTKIEDVRTPEPLPNHSSLAPQKNDPQPNAQPSNKNITTINLSGSKSSNETSSTLNTPIKISDTWHIVLTGTLTSLSNNVKHSRLELLSDDEALFEELEREEDNDVATMREKRIKEIQNELNRRHARAENQHGLYTDITKEKEFMDITTSEKYVVGHFYHKDFRNSLAEKYYDTRFIKIEVQNAPFLVEKLQIKVLPCVMAWVNGYAQTKIVGFDDLGNTDGFATAAIELKLIHAGVLKKKEDNAQQAKKSIFQSNDTDSELED